MKVYHLINKDSHEVVAFYELSELAERIMQGREETYSPSDIYDDYIITETDISNGCRVYDVASKCETICDEIKTEVNAEADAWAEHKRLERTY